MKLSSIYHNYVHGTSPLFTVQRFNGEQRLKGGDEAYCLVALLVFISVLFDMLISVLLYNAYGAADTHILTNQ